MPSPTSALDRTQSSTPATGDAALDRRLLGEFLRERDGFQFAVAVIDDDRERDAVIRELTTALDAEGARLVTIDLRRLPEDVVLLAAIHEALADTTPGQVAVQILGIERHLDISSGGTRGRTTSLLADANFQRDAFPSRCPAPLVLWTTSLALPAIADNAPDLWHWRAATFDLCSTPPDTPWADRLDYAIPRPDRDWEAQPKEDLHRRIAMLRRLLQEIGPDAGERRGRLLIELSDALYSVGDFEAAKTAGREAADLARRLSDRELYGVALGRTARPLAITGAIDDALALYEEELAIWEELGDRRSRAMTLGDIARIKARRGDIDDALGLHEEELGIYEELGDRRSRSGTLSDIARIKADRGAIDEALALHEEALAIYEELGDRRSRAITLGDIARIKAGRGDIDEALTLHEEKLAICKELGDKPEQANARWSIGSLLMNLADGVSSENAESLMNSAVEHLTASYKLLVELRHAAGIAVVGLDLAQLLATDGKTDEARTIAARSRDLFSQLKWRREQADAQALLDRLPPPTTVLPAA